MSQALDPALAALLADPRFALRRPPPGVTLDQFRNAANAFMAKAPSPTGCSSIDRLIDTPAGPLRLRLARPDGDAPFPAILFVHGGGFIFGSLDSHQAMARSLAIAANAVTVSVDYRLAPEQPYPAALDDVAAALDWVIEEGAAHGMDPTRLAIAGDSAGGQLALAAALRSGYGQALRHLGIFYPLLDPHRTSASTKVYSEGFMLTGEFIDWAWQAYGGAADDAAVHLLHGPLGDLPPTTIVTAQFDPLRDEGEALANQLRNHGIDVGYRCFSGMIHGFAGLPHVVPEAAGEAIDWVGQRIGASLAG